MRPQKITFSELRKMGLDGVLVYCADYRCSHSVTLPTDRWPDDVRLSDIDPRFVCGGCGRRGAEVRPDFNWNAKGPIGGMGAIGSHLKTAPAVGGLLGSWGRGRWRCSDLA